MAVKRPVESDFDEPDRGKAAFPKHLKKAFAKRKATEQGLGVRRGPYAWDDDIETVVEAPDESLPEVKKASITEKALTALKDAFDFTPSPETVNRTEERYVRGREQYKKRKKR